MSQLGKKAAYRKWHDGLTWNELTDELKQPRERIRSAARKYKAAHPDEFTSTPPKLTRSVGVTTDRPVIDPQQAIKRAKEAWQRTEALEKARSHQVLEFDHGPVCLVEMADLHLGGNGVNYPRLEQEMQLIADTDGMFVIGAGDWVNQMIVGKLKQEKFKDELSISDEWALLRYFLDIIKDKLVLMVMGNHDNWVESLTGTSYFREVLKDFAPKVLYDSDDARIDVIVGDWTVPLRVRHKWRGNSQWNDTHAIEKAAKFEQDFVIGMGAHTHASGLAREFNVAGRAGLALLAGSYKRVDSYAKREGFYRPNRSTAVSVVIDEKRRSLNGIGDLETAAAYMEAIY